MLPVEHSVLWDPQGQEGLQSSRAAASAQSSEKWSDRDEAPRTQVHTHAFALLAAPNAASKQQLELITDRQTAPSLALLSKLSTPPPPHHHHH